MIYPNIADLLKSSRKALGLSVKEVIDKLATEGIQVSGKTLYGWESGHRQPDADTFIALCVLYGIPSFSQLVEKKEPPAGPEGQTGGMKHLLTSDQVEQMLIQCGYIKKGEDLSDDDLRFLMSVGEVLDTWFSREK